MPHFPFQEDTEVFEFIKLHQVADPFILQARKNTTELKALIRGINFTKYLIQKIDFLESVNKFEARKKYSRSIKDFWERLLRLVDNVYTATGGSKEYQVDDLKAFLKLIMNIRGGLSLEKWLEKKWMKLYHSDPSGIIFLEYDSANDVKPFPTYKSINSIRWYESDGQKIKAIIFEPHTTKDGNMIWRVVDSLKDWRVLQKGNVFSVIDEKTFEHPFGDVPGMINSDIVDSDTGQRLSPIDNIIEAAKEYTRDLSVKSIYKARKGVPIDWRYTTNCKGCSGRGKIIKDDGTKVCSECGGTGIYKGQDVTDFIRLSIPKEGQTVPSPIAGSISPPLDFLTYMNEELSRQENDMHKTHWGVQVEQEAAATATEIVLDLQPAIMRLNDYSDVAENMEKQFTEWIGNFEFPSKRKQDEISAINYGRRFIIEPVDQLLQKYQSSKTAGDNNVILDRLFNEYLTAKHKSDMVALNRSLLKAEVEPYLHSDLNDIRTNFGETEAQKKMLFEEWWRTLNANDLKSAPDDLKLRFEEWFAEVTKVVEEPDNKAIIDAQATLRGSVGGLTGTIELLTAVAEQRVKPDAASKILVEFLGIDETVASDIVADAPTIENNES